MTSQPGQSDTPKRVCHYCGRPIPNGELAAEAKTGNAWAHFECWYDGAMCERDPETGERVGGQR